MSDKELEKAIKEVFFYHPLKGVFDSSLKKENKIFCPCGKIMEIKGGGSGTGEGDVFLECECGRKMLILYEFIIDYPKFHDKLRIVIEPCNCKGCIEFRNRKIGTDKNAP